MAKINIAAILTQFASALSINSRYQQIEDELNAKVLYRDNPDGEPNSMANDLDMAENSILNVDSLDVDRLVLDGQELIPGSALVTDISGTVHSVDSAVDLAGLTLAVGLHVRTKGYNTPGDNGENDYVIVPSGTGVADGINFIDTSDAQAQAISDYLTGQPFDTVADMVAAPFLPVGVLVSTKGYHTPGDGGGKDYVIVAAGTGTPDGGSFIDTATAQAKASFEGVAGLKDFGAMMDGVTDDDAAIAAWITYGNANQVKLVAPAGFCVYSGNYTITSALAFEGAGARETIFVPTATQTGWFLSVDECSRKSNEVGGEKAVLDDGTIDLDLVNSNVILRGFSNVGDRDNVANQHGIRTLNRVDQMLMEDYNALALTGTGLSIGDEFTGGSDLALCRESVFRDVIIRQCGSVTEPPFIISSGADVGDATNNLYFYNFRIVYPYSAAVIQNKSPTFSLRRIRFFGIMIHGSGGFNQYGNIAQVADDVMRIEGRVRDIKMIGMNGNGSTESAAVKYGVIRFAEVSGVSPSYITIDGDTQSCDGHGYICDKIGVSHFNGTVDPSSIAGNEVEFNANCVAAATVSYNVTGPQGGRSIAIDSTVERFISSLYVNAEDAPIIIESGGLRLTSQSVAPRVYIEDVAPEGVQTADRGSIFFKRTGDSPDSLSRLWVKASGTGDTDWRKVHYTARSNQAGFENIANTVNTQAPEQGQPCYDGTTSQPLWKDAGTDAGKWRDAAGIVVYTPGGTTTTPSLQDRLSTAWVSVDDAQAVAAAANISSITAISTGVKQLNFTATMSNEDYAWAGGSNTFGNSGGSYIHETARSTTSLTVRRIGGTGDFILDTLTNGGFSTIVFGGV